MQPNYLHEHPDYPALIDTVSDRMSIATDLVEKDYWIMHCLYGLKKQGFSFELKGGTSLSKGFGIIHRFSEDIDIRIQPGPDDVVYTGKNHNKPKHQDSRRAFYDQLAASIDIDGIRQVSRDTTFDGSKFWSGGIRLIYPQINQISIGIKEGILLELGFDTVTPNQAVNISSWALDFAKHNGMKVRDNQAREILCYDPRYTFVEKLQTISTKFRKQQESGRMPKNFMRHYYDLYCLLENEDVVNFIGSDQYVEHKKARFPQADFDIPAVENEAFSLTDVETRALYEKSYLSTRSLYYQDQPAFEALLRRLNDHIENL